MKISFSLASCLFVLALFLSACNSSFADNPHGKLYLDGLSTKDTKDLDIALSGSPKLPAHVRAAGLGAPLSSFMQKYGKPKGGLSHPPLYAFQVGPDKYPEGSILVVTIQDDKAVEFSYVAGTDHPMTYQEAQDIIRNFLPDDVTGPTDVQPYLYAVNGVSQCLAKGYQSASMATLFQSQSFLAKDGKDAKPGSIIANFYPDIAYASNGAPGTNMNGDPILANTTNASSVLVNLGSRPSC